MMDFICIIILSPNYYVFLINILKIYSSALKKNFIYFTEQGIDQSRNNA